jgi:hypothetical protein
VLTAEDIRFARNVDLQSLTGIDSTAFAAWQNSRGISERNIKLITDRLEMDKYEFLRGLELRRQDFATARAVQTKLEQIIASRQATQPKQILEAV